MLYTTDQSGVPWVGVTGIVENAMGSVESFHFDGVKYNDLVSVGDFNGSITAFTYPDEFLPYDGYELDQSGVYLTDQRAGRFSLSYTTAIGDDLVGFNRGYKIHLVYNLTALPSAKSWSTLGLTGDPNKFTWNISAIPERVSGHRPTAHVVIDSEKIDAMLLMDIEDILYGSEETEPRLPSLGQFLAFIRDWERFVIVDNGDGTWTASSKSVGDITMVTADEFSITHPNANFVDAVSYTLESTDKDEGALD
jgi:hypothetical protein